MLAALGIRRYVEAPQRPRMGWWCWKIASRLKHSAPTISAMTPGEHKVAVAARGDGDYDFVSRFFPPGVAVWEDPVTGSAHTMLIPYWSEKLGKTTMFCPSGFRAGRRRAVRAKRPARADERTGVMLFEWRSFSALDTYNNRGKDNAGN